MPRSWLSLLGAACCAACLLSCPAPYRPFCSVAQSRLLSAGPGGALFARANGEVARLSVKRTSASDGGSSTNTTRVEKFDRQGMRVADYALDVPGTRLAGLFGLVTFVDIPDGVALIENTFENTVLSDGGRGLFEQRSLELRSRDGGVISVELADAGCTPACSICGCLPNGYASLLRVGDNVVVDELSAGAGFSSSHRLRAFSSTGEAFSSTLGVESRSILPGADAVAVFPGPQLFSDQLEPLSTPPERPGELGSVAWSLADRVLTVARARDLNLVTQSFDFSGATVQEPARFSDGYDIAGVARSAKGTGILFDAAEVDRDGGVASQRWFAFVDRSGKKKGPDVAIAGGLQSGLLTASAVDDRFAIFTLGVDGVGLIEVQCE